MLENVKDKQVEFSTNVLYHARDKRTFVTVIHKFKSPGAIQLEYNLVLQFRKHASQSFCKAATIERVFEMATT